MLCSRFSEASKEDAKGAAALTHARANEHHLVAERVRDRVARDQLQLGSRVLFTLRAQLLQTCRRQVLELFQEDQEALSTTMSLES